MLEGFIVGLVVWSAPAVIAWLVAGPFFSWEGTRTEFPLMIVKKKAGPLGDLPFSVCVSRSVQEKRPSERLRPTSSTLAVIQPLRLCSTRSKAAI